MKGDLSGFPNIVKLDSMRLQSKSAIPHMISSRCKKFGCIRISRIWSAKTVTYCSTIVSISLVPLEEDWRFCRSGLSKVLPCGLTLSMVDPLLFGEEIGTWAKEWEVH